MKMYRAKKSFRQFVMEKIYINKGQLFIVEFVSDLPRPHTDEIFEDCYEECHIEYQQDIRYRTSPMITSLNEHKYYCVHGRKREDRCFDCDPNTGVENRK